MAVIDDTQRAGLLRLVGPEATAQFEKDLLGRAQKADEAGTLSKEETQETAPAEAEPEAEPEPVAEVAPPEIKAAPPAEDVVTKATLVEALGLIMQPLVAAAQNQDSLLNKQTELIAQLVQRLDTVESTVAVMKTTDEQRIADKAANTPAASMAALVLGQLGNQSAVGTAETRLNSNWNLAKDAPQIAPPAVPAGSMGPGAVSAGLTGIPFLDNLARQPRQAGGSQG